MRRGHVVHRLYPTHPTRGKSRYFMCAEEVTISLRGLSGPRYFVCAEAITISLHGSNWLWLCGVFGARPLSNLAVPLGLCPPRRTSFSRSLRCTSFCCGCPRGLLPHGTLAQHGGGPSFGQNADGGLEPPLGYKWFRTQCNASPRAAAPLDRLLGTGPLQRRDHSRRVFRLPTVRQGDGSSRRCRLP